MGEKVERFGGVVSYAEELGGNQERLGRVTVIFVSWERYGRASERFGGAVSWRIWGEPRETWANFASGMDFSC
jgi:hypothetical protein